MIFGRVINSKAAWKVYLWLINKEADWHDRIGRGPTEVMWDKYGYGTPIYADGDPPRHWLYHSLVRMMCWFGFIPF